MNCLNRIVYQAPWAHLADPLGLDDCRIPQQTSGGFWYATYCRSSQEALVEGQLNRAAIETYWPHRVRKDRHRHHVRDSVFPGYLFARLDLSGIGTRPVLEIPQVVRILGLCGQPVAIPDLEIASIRIMVDSPIPLIVQEVPLIPGDYVAVRKGPLSGAEGTVCYLKGKTRVVIAVGMLGQAISAEVEGDWLEVLKPAKRVA